MPVYALPAALTLDTASAVRRQALAALQAQPAPWVVDTSALQAFDSAALAFLLELRRAAPGQALEVNAVPARLRDLANAYGLAFLFGATDAPL
ncbi:MAG: STAS domain-containing protein [Thiomonas sp.]|uniref:STAS domain-containing protein n=1 Tax=Thiomonas sp. TaxID=2047785 RepID=UPI002A35D33E|nr:STAS domain-containing protein [Thiomonas sp.]MDY0330119.1 STAS domain-containing protein [Thiomonas sp.]